MKDQSKTKHTLIQDLASLRERITKLEQSESELKEAAEKKSQDMLNFLQTLINTIPSPIFCKDIDGVYQDCNKEFENYVGMKKEEIIGKRAHDLFPKDLGDKYREMDLALFHQPGRQIYEYQIMYADGTNRDVVVNKATYQNVDGALAGSVGVMVDITERRQAEATIGKSEEKYRNLFDNAVEGIYQTTPAGRIVSTNMAFARMFGYESPEEIVNTVTDIATRLYANPDDRKRLLGQMKDTGYLSNFECLMLRKDGSTFWVVMNARLTCLPDGASCLEGFLFDITKRKRAEAALQASEENFRRSLDESPLGIRIVTAEGETIYANQAILSIYCYDSIEELKTTPVDKRYTPESYAEFQIRRGKRKRGNHDPSEYEISIVRKDGEIRHLQVSRKEILWGGARHFQVIYQDITKRKQAEDALRESEKRLREAQKMAHLGFWYWDVKTGDVEWSEEVFKIFCLDPKEFTPQIDSIQALSPWPEDHQRHQELINRAIETHDQGFYEQKFLRPDQSIGYYYSTFQGNYDENGDLFSIVGTVLDITKRKLAEKQLQDTLDSLRKAFSTTVQVLVSAVETRDPYTAGHQIRSADLARAIATELGLPQDEIDGIRMAGAIHDIGKISVPAELLSKPIKLSDLEFSLIKEHAPKGYEMLKDVESPWPLAEIVYQHHERMDGSGYPQGLKGEEILMEARILAVADVVESMASHRPYRPALGLNAALQEIENNKGTLYDAEAVDACLRLFREKGFQLEGTRL
ncbi:MAG: PAS domain S-box protein [Syntrophales bacterium]|nr:PAS domain S-box protein [Syntrophales bacterium]